MSWDLLEIPDTWETYWTKYPYGQTIYESLIETINTINTMIEAFNELDQDLLVEKMDADGSNSNVSTLTFADGGVLSYDSDRQTMTTTNPDGTELENGVEFWDIGKAEGTITNGDMVQFVKVQGDHKIFKTAVAADIIANPTALIGMATQDAVDNQWVKVTKAGMVNGINTVAYSEGDILYFDPTTGGLTVSEPSTFPKIHVGVVDKVANNGIITIVMQPRSLNGTEVEYDNTTSGLAAVDAQNAIDEIEARVDTNEGDITTIEGDITTIQEFIADITTSGTGAGGNIKLPGGMLLQWANKQLTYQNALTLSVNWGYSTAFKTGEIPAIYFFATQGFANAKAANMPFVTNKSATVATLAVYSNSLFTSGDTLNVTAFALGLYE